MGKKRYSNKETLNEIKDEKNYLFVNKRDKNTKYIFTNCFKYMKGKILYHYMIMIILIIIIYSMNSSSSYIELTIPGPGMSKIFYEKGNKDCPSSITFPDEIYINDIEQSEKNSEYYFNNSVNIVKLVYNTNLQFMSCMFLSCSNITKIDFSHFDTSLVTSMLALMDNCTSLVDINFSNIDTSNVNRMHFMFKNCLSLKSVNLYNFVTTKVQTMSYMFCSCEQ